MSRISADDRGALYDFTPCPSAEALPDGRFGRPHFGSALKEPSLLWGFFGVGPHVIDKHIRRAGRLVDWPAPA
jgi:hypothetical protein